MATQTTKTKIKVRVNTIKLPFKEVLAESDEELYRIIDEIVEQIGFNGAVVVLFDSNGTVGIYWKWNGRKYGTSYVLEEFLGEVVRRLSNYFDLHEHDAEVRDIWDMFALVVEELAGVARDGVHFYEVRRVRRGGALRYSLGYIVTKFVVAKP